MEARRNKYRQVSPERAKVWTEKSQKYQQQKMKVSVVYYLCRNRQLEHPHFIEVPFSPRDGLYLRDVIDRLNVLRGRGMPSMYSWSCKRSYKNGFVWHDLCEDDLILPAHGNEYVLKGSELVEESNSGRPLEHIKMQNLKQLIEPTSSRSHDDSSSSSSLNEVKHSREDELSPTVQLSSSSGASPESKDGKNPSWGGSLSLTEYKVYQSDGLADASTQTEDNVSRQETQEACTRGVSTDDGSLGPECNESSQNHVPCVKENPQICRDAPSSSGASSSGGRTETLESLIRAEASKINSFRMLEEEEIRMPSYVKLKATNVLLQLISCGSVSVKDHNFGLLPTYRPIFSYSKFPSQLFSTSLMLRELDDMSENPRLVSQRLEDTEYFSGSLIESKMLEEDRNGLPALKHSSSYNADRTCNQSDSIEDREESSSGGSKCIPRSIKSSLCKPIRSEPMQSPVSDRPRNSASLVNSSKSLPSGTSHGGSKLITEPLQGKKPSKRVDSFREEERVIKIEERLASGARVIIQSKAPCNTAVGSL